MADSGDGGNGQLGFAASNVDLRGLDLSKVDDVSVSGTGCSINAEGTASPCIDSKKYAYKIVTQPDATRIGVYVFKSLRIEASSQLIVTGTIPIVIVALDTITLLGSLHAAPGKAGGYVQQNRNATGSGPGGGSGATITGNVVAGSGASYCGVGGAGAAQNTGSANAKSAPYGTSQIVPLVGGSAGGTGDFGATYGSGGGAIQLVAGTSINVAIGSYISVGGGSGRAGGYGSTQQASGGGSGGSILLEAPAVTVAGTLAVNGGGGGEGGVGGDNGEDGQPSNVAALGGSKPGGLSFGGNGSAGDGLNGSDGADTAGNTANAGGGSGGGGAGRIRINARSGQATITGTLSPTSATGCATIGVIP